MAGFERTPPFEYHDGYLSVHFATNNYLEIDLTPLQDEAVWYACTSVLSLPLAWHAMCCAPCSQVWASLTSAVKGASMVSEAVDTCSLCKG